MARTTDDDIQGLFRIHQVSDRRNVAHIQRLDSLQRLTNASKANRVPRKLRTVSYDLECRVVSVNQRFQLLDKLRNRFASDDSALHGFHCLGGLGIGGINPGLSDFADLLVLKSFHAQA